MSENVTNQPNVFDIDITRGKDGVLRCKFASKLLPSICQGLAEGKKKTVEVNGKPVEIWDCDEDLLGLAEECGLTSSESLLVYRSGKIESMSMAPLCAVALGSEGGLVLEPNYPYSATALDAYAKQLKAVVRTVLATIAPVEISVKLLMKAK